MVHILCLLYYLILTHLDNGTKDDGGSEDELGNNNHEAEELSLEAVPFEFRIVVDVDDQGIGNAVVEDAKGENNANKEHVNQKDKQQIDKQENLSKTEINLKRKSVGNPLDVEQTRKKVRTGEDDMTDQGTPDPITREVHHTDILDIEELAEAEEQVEEAERVENTAPTNANKSPAYSALNRKINSALQNLKAKVEEFQVKYGGESDFVLILKDNMTETNETGRTTRSNRKVVVTGQGTLCEAFKYKGLKFDPKTMQFTKKGKTLEKDFDMLEEWLDKKCEQSSPILSAPVTVSPSVVSTPPFQHQPFSHVPQMFQSPYPFQAFPYGHIQAPPYHVHSLSQATSPATASPVTPTSMPATNEPSAAEPEPELRPRQRRLLVSDSESNEESEQESEHGVDVKQANRSKFTKTKPKNLHAARRKSNPLVNNDILIGNENRNDKAAGKKSTKKVGTFNKAVKPPSNAAATKKSKEKTRTVLAPLTDAFNVTIDQRSKVTSWIREQVSEVPVKSHVENASTSGTAMPESSLPLPGTSGKSSTSTEARPASRTALPIARTTRKPIASTLSDPKYAGKSTPLNPKSGKTSPGSFVAGKPALPRPRSSRPAVPTKTVHPGKPGPVSARTMMMMEKVVNKQKPPPKSVTEDEISSLLNAQDIFRTPTRKRKV